MLSSGFAFRIKIRHDREYELGLGLIAGHANFAGKSAVVKATQSVASSISESAGTQAAQADAAMRLYIDVVRKPLLHQRLHAMHVSGGSNASAMMMSRVVRLAKMWCAGHNFSLHLSEEAIEIIVACLFLHPMPYGVPNSALAGLMRFLHLIGHWDWARSPLIVNIDEGMSDTDYAAAFEAFSERRDAKGGIPMCIITPEDKVHPSKKKHMAWTPTWTSADMPTASALERMCAVARSTLMVLEHLCESATAPAGSTASQKKRRREEGSDVEGSDDKEVWKGLFKSRIDASSGNFDIIAVLDTAALAPERGLVKRRKKQSMADIQGSKWLEQIFKNLLPVYHKKVMYGFDPTVAFVRVLKSRFGHLLDIFVNKLDPSKIGMKWKPGVLEPVRFSVAAAASTCPVGRDGKPILAVEAGADYSQVAVNVHEVVADIKDLGEGLVVDVILASGLDE